MSDPRNSIGNRAQPNVQEGDDSRDERFNAVMLTNAQEEELERCWQAYLADPKAGDNWSTVKTRLQGRSARAQ